MASCPTAEVTSLEGLFPYKATPQTAARDGDEPDIQGKDRGQSNKNLSSKYGST